MSFLHHRNDMHAVDQKLRGMRRGGMTLNPEGTLFDTSRMKGRFREAGFNHFRQPFDYTHGTVFDLCRLSDVGEGKQASVRFLLAVNAALSRNRDLRGRTTEDFLSEVLESPNALERLKGLARKYLTPDLDRLAAEITDYIGAEFTPDVARGFLREIPGSREAFRELLEIMKGRIGIISDMHDYHPITEDLMAVLGLSYNELIGIPIVLGDDQFPGDRIKEAISAINRLHQLTLWPSDFFHADSTPEGIRAANAIGAVTVGLESGIGTLEQLTLADATVVLARLSHLAEIMRDKPKESTPC